MKKKTVFSFDGKTGIYAGEADADESPLEEGVFLIPRNATEIAPPDEMPVGSAAFWRADHWEIEAVPVVDDNLDGMQDAPQGFAENAKKPGVFARIVKAIKGQ